jgi:hypothetical protein
MVDLRWNASLSPVWHGGSWAQKSNPDYRREVRAFGEVRVCKWGLDRQDR